MNTSSLVSTKRKVMTGNAAAAWAVMLCRPDVISGYPISPATEILEVLYEFQAEGVLGCEMVEPEGEHSVLSILMGASYGGARTFTATASQGLFFMYEPYIAAATQRLPIVTVNANREILPPTVVSASGQDIYMVKDAGWMQFHAENCQEILDSVIMAYKLAEDKEIMLPVTVAYDGFYLSYLSEAVDIPDREAVNQFVPKTKWEPRIDTSKPMTAAPWVSGNVLTEYRIKHLRAMQRAKTKIDEIEAEYEQFFGRKYGGAIEEYRCDDADILLVGMGSLVGTARVAVDLKRDEGIKAGLVKIRMFRPFPYEKLISVLKGRKAVGVMDRDVCFGWQRGHLMMEVQAALHPLAESTPLINFIGGLCGNDITIKFIARAIDTVKNASEGNVVPEVTFMDME